MVDAHARYAAYLVGSSLLGFKWEETGRDFYLFGSIAFFAISMFWLIHWVRTDG